MKVQVRKVGDGRWVWDCHRCQGGEYLRTQPAAYADALAHLPRHVGFGFQGGARVQLPSVPPVRPPA